MDGSSDEAQHPAPWILYTIGVADDRTVFGIEHDRLENDDEFMKHRSRSSRTASATLRERASTPG